MRFWGQNGIKLESITRTRILQRTNIFLDPCQWQCEENVTFWPIKLAKNGRPNKSGIPQHLKSRPSSFHCQAGRRSVCIICRIPRCLLDDIPSLAITALPQVATLSDAPLLTAFAAHNQSLFEFFYKNRLRWHLKMKFRSWIFCRQCACTQQGLWSPAIFSDNENIGHVDTAVPHYVTLCPSLV